MARRKRKPREQMFFVPSRLLWDKWQQHLEDQEEFQRHLKARHQLHMLSGLVFLIVAASIGLAVFLGR